MVVFIVDIDEGVYVVVVVVVAVEDRADVGAVMLFVDEDN